MRCPHTVLAPHANKMFVTDLGLNGTRYRCLVNWDSARLWSRRPQDPCSPACTPSISVRHVDAHETARFCRQGASRASASKATSTRTLNESSCRPKSFPCRCGGASSPESDFSSMGLMVLPFAHSSSLALSSLPPTPRPSVSPSVFGKCSL